MRIGRILEQPARPRRAGPWLVAALLLALAAYPLLAKHTAAKRSARRLAALQENVDRLAEGSFDEALPLRVSRLGPLLATWETIGGCGAGGTGGSGVPLIWVGRNTTGGLVHAALLSSDVFFDGGYNLSEVMQIDRDIDTKQKWNAGVVVPYLYKYYVNWKHLTAPVGPIDISNAGLGDMSVYLTRRLGKINDTSATLGLGIPTGTSHAQYRGDYLTQDQQLGLGNFTGWLQLSHTVDETWGLITFGGIAGYRGGRNDLGSYRAPTGSLYAYAGYFMGPFVPALGVSFTGFTGKDESQGVEQDLPRTVVAGSASLEWSTDYVAVIANVTLPYSLGDRTYSLGDWALQPWSATLGIAVSPF
jgi:hypothetical protein